jgi:hypothetical protein
MRRCGQWNQRFTPALSFQERQRTVTPAVRFGFEAAKQGAPIAIGQFSIHETVDLAIHGYELGWLRFAGLIHGVTSFSLC